MIPLGDLNEELTDKLLFRLDLIVEELIAKHFKSMWLSEFSPTWFVEDDQLIADVEFSFTALAPSGVQAAVASFEAELHERIDKEVQEYLSQV